MLKEIFVTLALKYSDDAALSQSLWQEIEKSYSGSKRYYHNLAHLENMYRKLVAVKSEISDWDTVIFSLFYHDIVYKATAKDNEEQSADVAVKCLSSIGYPLSLIQKCREQILATKHHGASNNNDTNFFTDADMAILGSEWNDYQTYYKAVRKEYSIYPDFLYNPGRTKVLKHFLKMPYLYNTIYFKNSCENVARSNIKKELEILI